MANQPKAEMSLDSLHTMGTQLETWLRMRAHPIAVKCSNPETKFLPMRLFRPETGNTNMRFARVLPVAKGGPDHRYVFG